MPPVDLTEVVTRILRTIPKRNNPRIPLEESEIRCMIIRFWFLFHEYLIICADIALKSRAVLVTEPTVLNIEGPLIVCGDLHGNLRVLREIFHRYGAPDRTRYLFLGGLQLSHCFIQ